MLSQQYFIKISLEINLFFQRIMKEHLFFIETNLQPVVPVLINEAGILKQNFEKLLAQTVYATKGVDLEEAIKSNEFVTPYTLRAEEINSRLTGANLNIRITQAELGLRNNNTYNYYANRELYNNLRYINIESINLLKRVIAFQKNLLAKALECNIFITLYHEMLEHDTREAENYLEILSSLQNGYLPQKTLCDQLNFWNNIMGEHSQFIDGMLDPTEKTLKATAETFAKKFEMLVKKCIDTAENQILQESLEATAGIIDYKAAAAAGLLKCEIKSIIPPLLADHVLREANHYLRLLS